jgi:hypothetical protein
VWDMNLEVISVIVAFLGYKADRRQDNAGKE